MMVNYLFPLTDKSPGPLRLSGPDSWQVEEGVNVTRGPRTWNGVADGVSASSNPNLDFLARSTNPGPDHVLGAPNPLLTTAPTLSSLLLIMLRKQRHPHEALHQNLSNWPHYFSLLFLIWLNGTITHPSYLTRNSIIIPNTSLFLMSHPPCIHLWVCSVV